jgi:hypothetical protein
MPRSVILFWFAVWQFLALLIFEAARELISRALYSRLLMPYSVTYLLVFWAPVGLCLVAIAIAVRFYFLHTIKGWPSWLVVIFALLIISVIVQLAAFFLGLFFVCFILHDCF